LTNVQQIEITVDTGPDIGGEKRSMEGGKGKNASFLGRRKRNLGIEKRSRQWVLRMRKKEEGGGENGKA